MFESNRTFFYFRHVHFIDFAKYTSDSVNPLYFNVVRDPMEHYRSYYYYVRRSRGM